MINKRSFIFNTLADALRFKISADPRNTTYRWGSFADDAEIFQGEPDIPYYSNILIRETNQMWQCNQFWLNDIERHANNDLTTERAERIVGDEITRQMLSETTQHINENINEIVKEGNELKGRVSTLEQTVENINLNVEVNAIPDRFITSLFI